MTIEAAKILGVFWAVVRGGKGGEWISADEISSISDFARHKATETDQRIPAWANTSPVVRMTRVYLVEVSSTNGPLEADLAEALRDRMIALLPGYDAAPGWSVEDRNVFVQNGE